MVLLYPGLSPQLYNEWNETKCLPIFVYLIAVNAKSIEHTFYTVHAGGIGFFANLAFWRNRTVC